MTCHAAAQLLKQRLAAEVDRSTGGDIQAKCCQGPGEMEADEHVVIDEVLKYGLAHFGCRGPPAAVVDHALRQHSTVLRATVEDSEHTAETVGEQKGRHKQ